MKQHPALRFLLAPISWPVAFSGAFLATLSGCALLADIGNAAPADSDVGAAGSKKPDDGVGTTQQEGGTTTPSATCLADLSTDVHNCGFCAHDCGVGGACAQGLCAPTPVSAAQGVRALVADEDHVFFTTEHDVHGCAFASSLAACTLVADATVVANAVKTDNGGGGGGDGSAMALDPRALALFGGRVFFADATNQAILACPETGCTASTIASVRPKQTPSFTGGLGADATTVVWGDAEGLGQGDLPDPGDYEAGEIILRDAARGASRIEMLRTGSSLDPLAFQASSGIFQLGTDKHAQPAAVLQGGTVRDFASDPQFFYVATKNTVLRVERATNLQTTLAQLPDATEILHVAADANGVYVTISVSAGEQRVARVREGGLDALAAAPALGVIALSSGWVYYTTTDTVLRVMR